MKRMLLVVAAALPMLLVDAGAASAAAAAAGIGAEGLDPGLRNELAAAGPQRMVDAVVVLKAQADLSAIRATTRTQRLRAVEGALRAKAAGTQSGMLALLDQRRTQRLVASVVPLWIANQVAVRAAPSVIRELATRPEVREVRPDVTIQAPEPPPASGAAVVTPAAPEPNVALVNAPALWERGFRGQGIVVANMDTGVDASHPDLASRWRGGTNSWYDPNGEHPTTPTDVNGHGTWTMGAMVGGDGGGTAIGVAPDAKWIAVKIFNDRGTTTATMIHRGFQWLLDPDGNPATPDAPNVVNDSWTMSVGGCYLDFQPDLRSLRAAGILPVFSAGNYGPTAGSVASPANNPEAFPVGATNDADVVDPSSSRGPSACGQAVAPKLVAPGVGVRTTDLYGLYRDVSGTSIAAPHAAGALALLLGAFPGLSADRQEAALQSGAVDLGAAGPDNNYGSGRLDVFAAYQWLASTPDFTVSVSPSSATVAAGGTASYSVSIAGVNGFVDDVTLSLSGLTAAQATWSFSPAVIQGGSGGAQLDVTTSATIAPGTYPLTITGSGPTAHTATATLVVPSPPDFGLSVSPSSRTVAAGGGTSYAVGVTSVNGFVGSVALSLSGLPTTVGAATFAPAVVAGAGSSQLTITTSSTAAPGTYPLTVTGTSGPLVHSAQITLVVNPRPDFGLSVSPSSRTVWRGGSTSYTASVSPVGGFTGVVTLSVSGLPSGATASFAPSSVAVPGSSTLTVKVGSRTTRGTFTLTLRGQNGSTVHQAMATLIVK
jgi:subtilisin family serine protease